MPGPTPDHPPPACRLGSDSPVAPGLRPAGVRPQDGETRRAGPHRGPQEFRKRLCRLWGPGSVPLCSQVCVPGVPGTQVCGSSLTSRAGASPPVRQAGSTAASGPWPGSSGPTPRLTTQGRFQPWGQVLEAGVCGHCSRSIL